MRNFLAILMTVVALGATATGAVVPQAKPADVSVTVAYTGKGGVDEAHPIWVFLFDSPEIGSGSVVPIMAMSVKKSGAAAVFKGVTADPVYIAVAYDEKGGYDGNSGPPPSGVPVSIYSTDGKGTPAAVKPAAKVKLSFDDSRRMQ
jgi:hypothetical protein